MRLAIFTDNSSSMIEAADEGKATYQRKPVMRFTRVWPKDPTTLAKRRTLSGRFRSAATEINALFFTLVQLAQLHWAFAISEICKGIALFAIGDLVVADELGEFLGTTAQNLCSLGEFEHFLYALARAQKVASGYIFVEIAPRR